MGKWILNKNSNFLAYVRYICAHAHVYVHYTFVNYREKVKILV